MKIELNYKKKPEKVTNMWILNAPEHQWIKEELKSEIKNLYGATDTLNSQSNLKKEEQRYHTS